MWMIVVMSRLGWPLRSCRAGFRVPRDRKRKHVNFANLQILSVLCLT